MQHPERYDIVVVGAGATGAILASRLTENRARKVLLIEAGAFYAGPGEHPARLIDTDYYVQPAPGSPHGWFFPAMLTATRTGTQIRGRVAGGSSTINGSYFIRGRREDFDGFAAEGNDQWSFDQVLPHFIALETDRDCSGPLHGRAGPVTIGRPPPTAYSPTTRAFIAACRDAGFADDPDMNDPDRSGVGPIPRNLDGRMRMNTAVTHLAAAASRPNLRIAAQTRATRVLFENRRAIGVEAVKDGSTVRYSGDEIILCAGGIASPHLLLLSGVGDAHALRQVGIEGVAHNPNIGLHMMDHPGVFVTFTTDDPGFRLPQGCMPLQTTLHFTATGSPLVSDMQISCHTGPANGTRGEQYLHCTLHLPRGRGRLSLSSADPDAPPFLDYRYLEHPDDRARLRDGVRLAVRLLEQPDFRRRGARRIAPLDAELASDDALDRWILCALRTTFHTSSTARMGPDTDPRASVDQHGRVRGTEGLRVLDISILPTIVRRGTSATAMMMGERAAAFFR